MSAQTDWRLLQIASTQGVKMISKKHETILIDHAVADSSGCRSRISLLVQSQPVDFSTASGAKQQLTDLHEFALLKSTFESDSGCVRLITQLSPT
ncbi:MAG: hypothetical protein ONA90_08620 [candidate division KSB1 bacterium]|nr:hypothetical protein [candidate division KSB1 bacterium]MDZ7369474.1 hypothetical protein [candidate division KSB1 bacterium]